MATDNQQKVISVSELWPLVVEYINYLQVYNQTSKVDDIFDLINQHEDDHGLTLKPMLEFMGKFGMPDEFPEDGSHFNETDISVCATFENTLIAESAFW